MSLADEILDLAEFILEPRGLSKTGQFPRPKKSPEFQRILRNLSLSGFKGINRPPATSPATGNVLNTRLVVTYGKTLEGKPCYRYWLENILEKWFKGYYEVEYYDTYAVIDSMKAVANNIVKKISELESRGGVRGPCGSWQYGMKRV